MSDSLALDKSNTVTFGEACKNEFLFHPNLTNLNHGSYGSTPMVVLHEQQRLQMQMESCPDEWFRRTSGPDWIENLKLLADFLSVDASDLVFVNNTTAGVNTILNAITYSPGDGILLCNLAYNAVLNSIKAVASRKGLQVYVVDIKFPIATVEDVIDKFRECMAKHSNIRIAVIDHITSGTAVKLPVRQLISLCEEFDVLSLIDGAHAVGQLIDLDIKGLDCDFYTGSLHKWLYTAKGCGFVHANPKHRDLLYPLVTSHNHYLGLQERFLLQGTRDDTHYFTVKPALKFVERMGGIRAIHEYNKTLLDRACEMLESTWGTSLLPTPDEMRAPYLRMVKLPSLPQYEKIADKIDVGSVGLLNGIYREFNVVVLVIPVEKCLYVRLSGQIFNKPSDYDRLVDAVSQVAKWNDETVNMWDNFKEMYHPVHKNVHC